MYPTIHIAPSFSMPSYAAFFVLGILCFLFILIFLFQRQGIKTHHAFIITFITLISGLMGSKALTFIYSVLKNSGSDPSLQNFWKADFGLMGGLLTALIAVSLYVWRVRLPYLNVFDSAVIAGAFTHGVARIGCFLNGCCFGKVTKMPWGMQFPFTQLHLHPTQAYEALFCFVLFGFLYRLFIKRVRPGIIGLSYFLLYSLWRFGIEFFRGDVRPILLHLTISQWLALIFMFMGLLFVLRLKTPNKPS